MMSGVSYENRIGIGHSSHLNHVNVTLGASAPDALSEAMPDFPGEPPPVLIGEKHCGNLFIMLGPLVPFC
jgi:hypothetical protein